MLPWEWGSQRLKTKLHIVYKRVSQHFSTFMNFKKKDLSVINIYWIPFREELRKLVVTKRLGHLQRHFNENVDHYKPSEENVKSKTLLKLFSKEFLGPMGKYFLDSGGQEPSPSIEFLSCICFERNTHQ